MSALADPHALGWLPPDPSSALPFLALAVLLVLLVQRATVSAVGAGGRRLARLLDVAIWPLAFAGGTIAAVHLSAVLG